MRLVLSREKELLTAAAATAAAEVFAAVLSGIQFVGKQFVMPGERGRERNKKSAAGV